MVGTKGKLLNQSFSSSSHLVSAHLPSPCHHHQPPERLLTMLSAAPESLEALWQHGPPDAVSHTELNKQAWCYVSRH